MGATVNHTEHVKYSQQTRKVAQRGAAALGPVFTQLLRHLESYVSECWYRPCQGRTPGVGPASDLDTASPVAADH